VTCGRHQVGELLLQDGLGDRGDEGGLVRDVPIEGRRLDAESLGELAQRHAVEAVGVEQCDGLGDDPLPVQCHKLAFLIHLAVLE
jgi:hypothetical protein